MKKKSVLVEKERKVLDLLQDFGFSYSDSNKILRNKDIKINGKATKSNDLVVPGDEVVFFYNDEMVSKRFEIVFESENVLVVFKRQGIETVGEFGLEKFLNAYAVHRLDRNTEGLLVFAKNEESQNKLVDAFKTNKVHKFYVAEVVGELKENKLYKAYLTKDKENSYVKVFSSPQKDSVQILTRVNTIKPGTQSSVVEIELLTGKTHQIRAHLAFLGHPIIGDGKYGREKDNKKFKQTKQKLCCYKLVFDNVGIDELDGKEFVKMPEWQNF